MTEFLRITIHVLEIIFFYLGCIQEMWFPVKLANTEKKEEKLFEDDAHYQENISKARLSKL